MNQVSHRELICEFVGTFTLLFVIVGMTSANAQASGGPGVLGTALAAGLTIAVMATACGPISGGQFNPAVTTGLMAAGKMRPLAGLAYILAQLAGACAGTYVGEVVFRPALGSSVVLNTIPTMAKGYHPSQAYLCEIVLTFFLMFVIYGTAVSKGVVQKAGGLFIGLTVTLCILAGSHISGAIMNPAVWFGPSAIAAKLLNDGTLTYTIGPIFGALVASTFWAYVIEDPKNRGN